LFVSLNGWCMVVGFVVSCRRRHTASRAWTADRVHVRVRVAQYELRYHRCFMASQRRQVRDTARKPVAFLSEGRSPVSETTGAQNFRCAGAILAAEPARVCRATHHDQ
jgi:hypothetical protein